MSHVDFVDASDFYDVLTNRSKKEIMLLSIFL